MTLPARPPLDAWGIILLCVAAVAALVAGVELWVRREKRKPEPLNEMDLGGPNEIPE